jgi:hypothetical protein
LKINNTAVEDMYWDSQAVHYYTTPMFQIKQQFINKFSYLKAEHRALGILILIFYTIHYLSFIRNRV